MHGDFSRWTFRSDRHFSNVLYQQGRVSLEADANEQGQIFSHLQRSLVRDLVGPFGGPAGDGFRVVPRVSGATVTDVEIGEGRYYVDGIAVEHARLDGNGLPRWPDDQGQPQPAGYYRQPFAFLDPAADELPDPPFVVYLRVWERLVTAIEEPSIREIALGRAGPDTAARTQVLWQLLATDAPTVAADPLTGVADLAAARTWVDNHWGQLVADWQAPERGRLRARAKTGDPAGADPCVQSPLSRYRGPENQLYRVEIHHGGRPGDGATFKWSRDNGTVAFALDAVTGNVLTLRSWPRDERLGIDAGDWVEVVDDAAVFARSRPGYQPPRLLRVRDVDPFERRVTLDDPVAGDVGRDPARHPLVRRWDVTPAAGGVAGTRPIPVTAPPDESPWLDLEDGVQVAFRIGPGERFRSGDFWLIPARTETGDVEWPGEPDADPLALPPLGIEDHFAPLAIVYLDAANEPKTFDVRRLFQSLAQYATP